VKQTELDAGLRSDGLTTEERAELQQLRRENKRLRMEQEILTTEAGQLQVMASLMRSRCGAGQWSASR
jgi:transposase-like protein